MGLGYSLQVTPSSVCGTMSMVLFPETQKASRSVGIIIKLGL